ncbi:uncharacterized protein LOC115608977 [Strigops habroptila]|uniref:uncharacterized protein LOC115601208 n=1 Tax=Strigops habroptila TaxID=2489341 RepID=UPI0011CF6893|nr:uncharacterized protein LOC115601208 [Strigops habroptila]XP_030344421.1 uncharacterized protein LOC115608977 [Strigops habroptila]
MDVTVKVLKTLAKDFKICIKSGSIKACLESLIHSGVLGHPAQIFNSKNWPQLKQTLIEQALAGKPDLLITLGKLLALLQWARQDREAWGTAQLYLQGAALETAPPTTTAAVQTGEPGDGGEDEVEDKSIEQLPEPQAFLVTESEEEPSATGAQGGAARKEPPAPPAYPWGELKDTVAHYNEECLKGDAAVKGSKSAALPNKQCLKGDAAIRGGESGPGESKNQNVDPLDALPGMILRHLDDEELLDLGLKRVGGGDAGSFGAQKKERSTPKEQTAWREWRGGGCELRSDSESENEEAAASGAGPPRGSGAGEEGRGTPGDLVEELGRAMDVLEAQAGMRGRALERLGETPPPVAQPNWNLIAKDCVLSGVTLEAVPAAAPPQAFPVQVGPQGGAMWTPLDAKLVQALHKAIKEEGLSSETTPMLLDSAHVQPLAPADARQLARAVLTGLLFLLLKEAWYLELQGRIQAATTDPTHPLRQSTFDRSPGREGILTFL